MTETAVLQSGRKFINAKEWVRGLIRATIKPRPRVRIWKWADENVVIPDNGFEPGPLNTNRFPVFRGLYDLAQQRGVHFVTLCASARVGKTLFSIVCALYWIAERIGSAAWLDPSKSSAIKFVKDELEDFIQLCAPVRRIAICPHKSLWTTLWKTFRGKVLRIIGSGAEADLHGFNASFLNLNELDRARSQTESDAASYEKLIARTNLYKRTRLIIENSTPGEGGELSAIWRKFLKGSQHHCYVPCPHCSDAAASQPFVLPDWDDVEAGRSPQSYDVRLKGWQRLTFTPETKLVPFDEDLNPLPKGTPKDRWREEKTGGIRFEQFAIWTERTCSYDATKKERVKVGYDIDAVDRGATYRCAHCEKDIPWVKLEWMLARFRWIAHNPAAPSDRISAHLWKAYSPFETWGTIAKEFIEAKGDLGALIKFENLTKGLPFIQQGAAIKEEDIDRAVARTPVRYAKGEIPREAEILTMTVDKQGTQFWYLIRAWGVLWDHPDKPTWSALVDWGEAVSWDQILELAGHKADGTGRLRRFVWSGVDAGGLAKKREYDVTLGLVDSGFEPEDVYEFCLKQSGGCFDPYKGGDLSRTGGAKTRISKVLDGQLDLWWCWSDFFARNLYYDCIRWGNEAGEPVHWWLPVDIDEDYKKQLCDEYRDEDNKWKTRTKNNHLGDDEKMQRVLRDPVEEVLDAVRSARELEEEERAA